MATPVFVVSEIEEAVIDQMDLKTIINYRSTSKLYRDYWYPQIKILDQTVMTDDVNQFIQTACRLGFTNGCKYLYNSFHKIFGKYINFDAAFNICCRLGRLDLAKWMQNAVCIRNSAFYLACINDQGEILEWLYKTAGNIIRPNQLIRLCIYPEKLKAGRCLLKFKEINKKELFIRCCGEGKIRFAKLIHAVEGKISNKTIKSALRATISSNKYDDKKPIYCDIADWLNGLLPNKNNQNIIGNTQSPLSATPGEIA